MVRKCYWCGDTIYGDGLIREIRDNHGHHASQLFCSGTCSTKWKEAKSEEWTRENDREWEKIQARKREIRSPESPVGYDANLHDSNHHRQKGNELFEEKQYSMAIQEYNTALSFLPGDLFITEDRAFAYMENGQYDKAIDDFTAVIAGRTAEGQCGYSYYEYRGEVYLKKGDRQKAAADFRKALSLGPNENKKNELNGLLKQAEGALEIEEDFEEDGLPYSDDEEEAEAEEGDEDFDEDDLPYSDDEEEAEVEEDDEVFEEALVDFDDEEDAKDASVLCYKKGEAYRVNELFDKALDEYTKAIALYPGNAAPYRARGLLYVDKNQFDNANDDFIKMIDCDPDTAADVASLRKEAKQRQEQWEAAEKQAQLEGKQRQAQLEAKQKQEQLEAAEKEAARARAAAEEYENKILNTAGTYRNRGKYFNDRGKYDRAIADYTRAIEMDPKIFSYYRERGEVYLKIHDKQKAIEDLKMALKLGGLFMDSYPKGIITDLLKKAEKLQ